MIEQKDKKFEKRRYPRIESKHLVSYTTFDLEEMQSESFMGSSMNLSKGGIKLEIPRLLRIADGIDLDLIIEDKIISVKGRIVYQCETERGSWELGIEFLEVKPEDAELLDSFLTCKQTN